MLLKVAQILFLMASIEAITLDRKFLQEKTDQASTKFGMFRRKIKKFDPGSITDPVFSHDETKL